MVPRISLSDELCKASLNCTTLRGKAWHMWCPEMDTGGKIEHPMDLHGIVPRISLLVEFCKARLNCATLGVKRDTWSALRWTPGGKKRIFCWASEDCSKDFIIIGFVQISGELCHAWWSSVIHVVPWDGHQVLKSEHPLELHKTVPRISLLVELCKAWPNCRLPRVAEQRDTCGALRWTPGCKKWTSPRASQDGSKDFTIGGIVQNLAELYATTRGGTAWHMWCPEMDTWWWKVNIPSSFTRWLQGFHYWWNCAKLGRTVCYHPWRNSVTHVVPWDGHLVVKSEHPLELHKMVPRISLLVELCKVWPNCMLPPLAEQRDTCGALRWTPGGEKWTSPRASQDGSKDFTIGGIVQSLAELYATTRGGTALHMWCPEMYTWWWKVNIPSSFTRWFQGFHYWWNCAKLGRTVCYHPWRNSVTHVVPWDGHLVVKSEHPLEPHKMVPRISQLSGLHKYKILWASELRLTSGLFVSWFSFSFKCFLF